MSPTQTVLKGVIHGKTIELEMESGLPDGQPVDVKVQPRVETGPRLPPGEGIRRSAGAWADDPAGLDEFLKQLRQCREQDRAPIEPRVSCSTPTPVRPS
jgi:hypothetical protein